MPDPRPTHSSYRPSQLSIRMLGGVLLATLLSGGGVGVLSYLATQDFLRRHVERTYPAVLDHTSERLVTWLEEGKTDLRRLSGDSGLVSSLGSARAANEVDAWLTASLGSSRFFEALLIVDAEGQVLHHAGSTDDLPPPAQDSGSTEPNEMLWATRADFRGSPLVASTSLPKHAVRLHGVFRSAGLEALLDHGELGEVGALCFVDSNANLRSQLCPRSLPGAPRIALPLPVAHLASGGVSEYASAAGDRVFGAARPIGVLGWHLLLEVPVDQALAPLTAILRHTLAVVAALGLGGALLARRMARSVVRPILGLTDVATRIADGELDTELPEAAGADDVGRLTTAFRDMTTRLLESQSRAHGQTARLSQQNEELQRANEVLEQLSITDGLTRLHNHRFFQDHLTREIKRVSRTHEPLAMLVLDIDDFKRLNDRQGHKAGDELLLGLARILNESIRENDFVARYGGEEFVVLAPVTDLEGAVALAEKIRTAVAEASFILGDSKQITKVSVSIGVASYKGNRRAFFQAADQALYRAKAAGKNCVMADES